MSNSQRPLPGVSAGDPSEKSSGQPAIGLPANAVPTGALPADAIPPGALPPGALPPGALPPSMAGKPPMPGPGKGKIRMKTMPKMNARPYFAATVLDYFPVAVCGRGSVWPIDQTVRRRRIARRLERGLVLDRILLRHVRARGQCWLVSVDKELARHATLFHDDFHYLDLRDCIAQRNRHPPRLG